MSAKLPTKMASPKGKLAFILVVSKVKFDLLRLKHFCNCRKSEVVSGSGTWAFGA